MSSEINRRQISYRQLIVYAVGIGIIVGFLATAYYFALGFGLQLIWHTIPNRVEFSSTVTFRSYVWIFTTIGGFLVGLTARYLGAPSGMDTVVDEIHKTGQIDYRQTPGMVVASLLSLIFGSSAGPETPLVDINGSIGSWLGNQLKLPSATTRVLTFCGMSAALGAFFGSPLGSALLALELPHCWGLEYYEALIPVLVSALLGFAVFRLCAGLTIGGLYEFPPYTELKLEHLLFAALLGIIGALVAVVFIILFRGIGQLTQPLTNRPLLLTTLGGLGIGLIATVLPLTLFYGETQIQTIVDIGSRLGVGLLLLIALGKMLTVSLSLQAGFRGGFIFPLFFIGAAVGMAVSLVIPQIPPTVGMVCTMAAVTVAAIKTPVSVVLILTVISHTEMIPVITVATIVSFLLTTRISLIRTQRSRLGDQS
jgi:H+/Cl- antiporter ClcA